MAGSELCSHCKTQKDLFKGAFEEIMIPAGAYKDCALEEEWCDEHEIYGYPSWVTPEGSRIEGVQTIANLKKASGCN